MNASGPIGYRTQRGSALVWVVSLTFIVLMVALVIESSRLYFAQRQLQSAANQLATLLVEEAQTCGGTGTRQDLLSKARLFLPEKMRSNPDITVEYATFSLVEMGTIREVSPEQSNAVSVSLKQKLGGLLGKMLVTSEVILGAKATSKREVIAGISVDSDLLSINTANAPLLNPVFSSLLGTSGLDWRLGGLDDLGSLVTNVDEFLHELLENTGLSSVEDILNEGVYVADILEAVLHSTESITPTATALIDGLIDNLGEATISVQDVISGVQSASSSGAKINALGLVRSAVLNAAAALEKPIKINLLGDYVPGLGDVLNAEILLDAAPSSGYMLASAKQGSDGSWPVAESGNLKASITTSLGIPEFADIVSLEVHIKTGQAKVMLEGGSCAFASDNDVSLDLMASTSLLDLHSNLTLLGLKNPPIGLQGSLVSINLGAPGGSYSDDFGAWRKVGGTDVLSLSMALPAPLGEIDGSTTTVRDLVASVVGDAEICVGELCICSVLFGLCDFLLKDLLRDVVSPVLDGLISSLLNALGIRLVPTELTLESITQQAVLIEKGVDNL